MARKKVESIVAEVAPGTTPQEHAAAMEKLARIYEDRLDDQMGLLHNRFVAYISEAALPLPQVLLVLEMLKLETTEQAKKKYLGE